MPASARLAHDGDPGAIWSQFSDYTPLVICFARVDRSAMAGRAVDVTVIGRVLDLLHGGLLRRGCGGGGEQEGEGGCNSHEERVYATTRPAAVNARGPRLEFP